MTVAAASVVRRRAHRLAAAVGHRDPVRPRGRATTWSGVTFECDHPVEARTRRIVSTSALPEGLTPAEIDAAVVGPAGGRRGPLPPRRRRPGRPGRRPGGHPGPVRGLRGRRLGRRRRAGPPRLPGRGADPRPADPRRGARLGRARSGTATGREAAARAWWRRCAPGWTPCGRRWPAGEPVPVMVLEWTDPPFAPGHWVPEMVGRRGRRRRCSARPARSRCGRPGRRSPPPAPAVVVAAPCGFGLDDSARLAAEALAAGRPARRTAVGGRRQRVLRPARPAAGRRRRGAGRDPAPGRGRAPRRRLARRVLSALTEGVQGGHVVGGQLEAGDVGVGPDPLLLGRLRDHHDAVLEVPADDHLGGGAAEPVGDAGDRRVLEGAAAQGAVALEDDAALAVSVERRRGRTAAGSTRSG